MWIPIFSCGWRRCGAVPHLYSCGRCIPASYFPTTRFLLWMAPLPRCTTPLLVGMMHPCILPSHYLLSLVDGAAAALSYTFTRGDDASLHLTFPLPTFSCRWRRCGAVLHLYSWGWCIPASYLATTHFLLWMVPLRRCPTPLLVGMMHPCILPPHYPLLL